MRLRLQPQHGQAGGEVDQDGHNIDASGHKRSAGDRRVNAGPWNVKGTIMPKLAATVTVTTMEVLTAAAKLSGLDAPGRISRQPWYRRRGPGRSRAP